MTVTLETLPSELFLLLLVFARLGATVMLLPVYGEPSVNPRARLAIALCLTLLVTPVVRTSLPAIPAGWPGAMGLLVGEVLVGLAVGGLIRLFMAALHVAGSVIAMQTGLAFSMTFDPTQGTQSVMIATFLSLLAVALILATDLHHPLLAAAAESYRVFPAGAALPIADISGVAARWFADAFLLGLTLSFPFLVFGFTFYLAMGVLAKLMPQLQIFFLVQPVNIAMGYAILAVVLSGLMLAFLNAFGERLDALMGR
ncbi:MAG: flagellar biosynthetic protein FliR [Alphaproteobacteria bacterium]